MNTITSPAGKKFAITKEVLTTLMSTISSFEYLFKNSKLSLADGHGVMLSGGGEDPETGGYRNGLIYLNNEVFLLTAGDESTVNYEISDTPTTIAGVDLNGNQYETVIHNRIARASVTGPYLFSNLHSMPIMLQRKRFELSSPGGLASLHADLELITDCALTHTDSRTGMFTCTGKVRVKESSYIAGNVDINIFSVPSTHSLPSHPTAIDQFYFTVYIKRVGTSPLRTYTRTAYLNKADRKVYIHNSADDVFNLVGSDEIFFDFGYYTDYVSV